VGPTCQRLGEGARAARLGPTWAERGKEREKERLGRKRPKDQEGKILNFLTKTIYEMMFQLLKILPLLK
jgi:hypothetical protein